VAIPVAVTTKVARAASHVGVHVHHVGAVAERSVGARHGLTALGDGQALPGQRGLVDLQRGRRQQPPVRGHDIARLHRDDVAGDQLPGGKLRQLAVPPHPGRDDHHLLQGGDGRGGLPLLMQALDRVEQRQQDQQDARAELLERVQAADAGREQHELHRVAVLPDECVPAGLGPADGELVRAEFLDPHGRLGRAETALPVHPFGAKDLIDAKRVPREFAGRWRPSRSRCIRHSRSHLVPRARSDGWYGTSAKLSSLPGPAVSPASDQGCGRIGTSQASCWNFRSWQTIQSAWAPVSRSGMRRRPTGMTRPLKWS
jgi:hypothetical protein